jgi:hypothetical protein
MLSTDKRASLSSKLLSPKVAPAQSGDGAAGMRARAERLTARRRSAAGELHDTGASDPGPDDTVLATKGGASASGFRPLQWSYERDGRPHSNDEAGTVTPFPISAPAQASSAGPVGTLVKSRSPGITTIAVTAFGVLALVTSASLLVFSRTHEPNVPQPSVVEAPAVVDARDIKPAEAPTAEAVPTASAQPATVAPAPPQVAAAPPQRAEPSLSKVEPAEVVASEALSPREIAGLVARGDQLLATGDIVAARVFYQRAAEHGDAAAATAAGKTFDPLFLEGHAAYEPARGQIRRLTPAATVRRVRHRGGLGRQWTLSA